MDVDLRIASPQRAALTAPVPTPRSEIGATIREQLDLVWSEVHAGRVKAPGHNVVLYQHTDPMEIASGVVVGEPFDGSAKLRAVDLPTGEVLHAVHLGPYDRLGQTHDAVHAHAREIGRAIGEWSWEIYGDWDNDPEKLVTEVVYLLKPGPGQP